MKTTKITPVELLAAGYRKGPSPFDPGHVWQKIVKDSEGKKLYFLNFSLWEIGGHIHPEITVMLYRQDGVTHAEQNETAFRVDLRLGPNTTIEQVEAFYAAMYATLGCVPDMHNN